MSKLTWIILITLVSWSTGTVIYAYCWLASILSDPYLPVYERNGLLSLADYRLPYLLIGLVVIVVIELS